MSENNIVTDSIIKNNNLKSLLLKVRFQSNYPMLNVSPDKYDEAVSSPKSVVFSADGKKFYVHSLAGFTTICMMLKKLQKLKRLNMFLTPQIMVFFK